MRELVPKKDAKGGDDESRAYEGEGERGWSPMNRSGSCLWWRMVCCLISDCSIDST